MIQLYTGTDFNEPQNTGYAHPLLQYLFLRFEKLEELFQLTAMLATADFVVLPLAIEYFQTTAQKHYLHAFVTTAKQNNKPILLFSTGDFGTTLQERTIFTLRLGGFDSLLNTRTEIMSPFIEDPLLLLGLKFKTLAKTQEPQIGFVGHANGGVLKYGKEILLFAKGNARRLIGKDTTDYQHFYPSSYYRNKYLKKIQKKQGIVTHFIFRKHYRAGIVTMADKRETSLEFYTNIFQNQYVFCLRGTGNFSVRLYETLALGRIPVLINTDCRLPFQTQINWKSHCLFIEEHDVDKIGEKILEFHNTLTPTAFEKWQKDNRALWQTYFTKENYFVQYAKVVHDYLLTIAND
ncbi:exostosin domain-containing protein [Flavobacterium restrictum]|uniref:Exostosin family protein n=1 Tax=Flavobacterium restrictum TaxID=2594428 RepID=A0A553E8E6_9FLAO|nr:exostosin family protein [Flavobacterium restrictum]TRX41260.1 exostosin family protein [Flavobacterium restrictum]